ncbi:hypothetical protein FO519_003827 [Halicephalobus sp. NKZ332]|nr:hypothetical protein FO519_003827 [Halicephalobus sp. NKZ332]
MLFLFARMVLGGSVVLSFCNFARAVESKFGKESALFLRVITASQFHFMFYCSRPLPNTFALILVLWVYQLVLDEEFQKAIKVATFSAFILRFELVLLFGPIFLIPIIERKLSITSAVVTGIITLVTSLIITVPIDSILWRRVLWPEGEVIWFNVVENKSHNYGTSPFLWYFTRAIPKALAASTVLIPVGIFFDRRLLKVVLPTVGFIFLYSFLPHKELRFIIYVFPILNLAAAVFCARVWINKWKSWIRCILALGVIGHIVANGLYSSASLYASSSNYPGGTALSGLQFKHRYLKDKAISVHIDPFCAESGISRFFQIFPSWEYNKTENLSVEDLQRFDYLLFGNTTTELLREQLKSNFSETHKESFSVEGFHRIKYKKMKTIPLPYPVFIFKEKVIVLRKL